jgi:DNA-binding NarL/FixJ family response regulator
VAFICSGIRKQPMTTILLIAHHEPLRQSLRDWLAINLPQCQVVGETDAMAAIKLAQNKALDAIIIDIDTPQENGFETLRCIQAAAPEAQIVAFGLDETESKRSSVMEAGATAYLPKSKMQTELIFVVKATFGIVNDERWNTETL